MPGLLLLFLFLAPACAEEAGKMEEIIQFAGEPAYWPDAGPEACVPVTVSAVETPRTGACTGGGALVERVGFSFGHQAPGLLFSPSEAIVTSKCGVLTVWELDGGARHSFPAGNVRGIHETPRGFVLAAFGGGVTAVDADGGARWAVPGYSDAGGHAELVQTPEHDVVLVRSVEGEMTAEARSGQTGAVLWTAPLGRYNWQYGTGLTSNGVDRFWVRPQSDAGSRIHSRFFDGGEAYDLAVESNDFPVAASPGWLLLGGPWKAGVRRASDGAEVATAPVDWGRFVSDGARVVVVGTGCEPGAPTAGHCARDRVVAVALNAADGGAPLFTTPLTDQRPGVAHGAPVLTGRGTFFVTATRPGAVYLGELDLTEVSLETGAIVQRCAVPDRLGHVKAVFGDQLVMDDWNGGLSVVSLTRP